MVDDAWLLGSLTEDDSLFMSFNDDEPTTPQDAKPSSQPASLSESLQDNMKVGSTASTQDRKTASLPSTVPSSTPPSERDTQQDNAPAVRATLTTPTPVDGSTASLPARPQDVLQDVPQEEPVEFDASNPWGDDDGDTTTSEPEVNEPTPEPVPARPASNPQPTSQEPVANTTEPQELPESMDDGWEDDGWDDDEPATDADADDDSWGESDPSTPTVGAAPAIVADDNWDDDSWGDDDWNDSKPSTPLESLPANPQAGEREPASTTQPVEDSWGDDDWDDDTTTPHTQETPKQETPQAGLQESKLASPQTNSDDDWDDWDDAPTQAAGDVISTTQVITPVTQQAQNPPSITPQHDETDDEDEDDDEEGAWKKPLIITSVTLLILALLGAGAYGATRLIHNMNETKQQAAAQQLEQTKLTKLQNKWREKQDEATSLIAQIENSPVKDDTTVGEQVTQLRALAKKNLMREQQLEQYTPQLDKAITATTQAYKTAMQQHVNKVQATLNQQIAQAEKLSKAPDSTEKKTMSQLVSQWKTNKVTDANAIEASKAATQLEQLVQKVQQQVKAKEQADKKAVEEKAKKEAEEQAKKEAEQQQQQQQETPYVPQTPQYVAPQTPQYVAPQPAQPAPNQPQQPAQPAPTPNGNSGVHL